jgi:hypothetical protein
VPASNKCASIRILEVVSASFEKLLAFIHYGNKLDGDLLHFTCMRNDVRLFQSSMPHELAPVVDILCG